MSRLFNRFVSWLHAGYPSDIPPTDRVPLVALLASDFSPADSGLVPVGQGAE